MGLVPSLMRKGLSQKQIVSLAMEGVLKNLGPRRTANSALPGRHFEAPSRREVEKAFAEWKSSSDDKKEKIFMKLLESTKLGEIDNITLIVGLAIPPFSMVAKSAGEKAPPFKMIKNVPDALFVPSFTLLSLVSVKLIRKVLENFTLGEEEEEKGINAGT
ncbi:uncharacterized protein LOC117932780 isoform X2 [Vitis riparia]|uniref:uncharacterized protein LOC117932780 isoform X2 n=1 Tax=Vitis riparia TaxID=96939 RepID=UPI00155B14A7|nr:uncharacterized protein LOC117932780 isoform X2 [Vitis riparia]